MGDNGMLEAYRAHPALAAKKAAWHRQRAAECRERGFINHEVAHYDRADEFEAVLDRLERCRRCGRKLEDPDSVARRVGPECRRRETKTTVTPQTLGSPLEAPGENRNEPC